MVALRTPAPDEVGRDWAEFTGGAPVLAAFGAFMPADVEALELVDEAAGRRALITWKQEGDTAELVSVHAAPPGGGAGAELLAVIEARLRAAGVRRLLVATTNDNIDAVRFYQRHGFRLVRIHLDWMDRVRERKPHVPRTGNHGLPLQDLWELEKQLAP
ncbi:MAG: GNAT family N-acetyltransferase [Dehalococcoidia bacterium]|nr:GNAT family N-acetyltransferase [Dehalococcoidia bacterium]